MSFTKSTQGKAFAPGWFLASADCARQTRQMLESLANDDKIVPMGTIYPANDSTAEGIVYEDIDISTGEMPGSVVLSGRVYKDRLPVEIDSAAETALKARGFVFETEPTVTRPE